MNRICVLLDMGLLDYGSSWQLQHHLVNRRLEDDVPDLLLLLEHPPVYTVGRRGSSEGLDVLGLPVYEVERGGDVTYHGPGQLVGYPIVALPRGKLDVKRFVTQVEDVILRTLRDFSIEGEKGPHSGVWMGEKKLASIGVAVKHHVTYHGFALNVNADLAPFRLISPCGISGTRITSMAEVRGAPFPLDVVKETLVTHFSEVFEREMWNPEGVPGLVEALGSPRAPS